MASSSPAPSHQAFSAIMAHCWVEKKPGNMKSVIFTNNILIWVILRVPDEDISPQILDAVTSLVDCQDISGLAFVQAGRDATMAPAAEQAGLA